MYYNVVSPSLYGPIIINRHDQVVGYNVSMLGAWMQQELEVLRQLCAWAHAQQKPVVFVDVGANIGMHSLAVASLRLPRLQCTAIEAQRAFFYQVCGTLALNGLSHVHAMHRVVSERSGAWVNIPQIDLQSSANFGAFSLAQLEQTGFNGKLLGNSEAVESIALDDLILVRDTLTAVVLKIDIEGMEPQALAGAAQLLRLAQPALLVEYAISGREPVMAALQAAFGNAPLPYRAFELPDQNLLLLPNWCDGLEIKTV
jgi:FkbM family methyltransferase